MKTHSGNNNMVDGMVINIYFFSYKAAFLYILYTADILFNQFTLIGIPTQMTQPYLRQILTLPLPVNKAKPI